MTCYDGVVLFKENTNLAQYFKSTETQKFSDHLSTYITISFLQLRNIFSITFSRRGHALCMFSG